jgi:hypothetical protein
MDQPKVMCVCIYTHTYIYAIYHLGWRTRRSITWTQMIQPTHPGSTHRTRPNWTGPATSPACLITGPHNLDPRPFGNCAVAVALDGCGSFVVCSIFGGGLHHLGFRRLTSVGTWRWWRCSSAGRRLLPQVSRRVRVLFFCGVLGNFVKTSCYLHSVIVSHFMLSQSFSSCMSVIFILCMSFYDLSAISVFLQPFYAMSAILSILSNLFYMCQLF